MALAIERNGHKVEDEYESTGIDDYGNIQSLPGTEEWRRIISLSRSALRVMIFRDFHATSGTNRTWLYCPRTNK